MIFETELCGHTLFFETAETLFSPRAVDAGTRFLLEHAEFLPDMRVLDLGCGYGAIGVTAAKSGCSVVMTDIDPTAAECARKNLGRNGVAGAVVCGHALEAVDETGFDLICANPPYHTDYSVAKAFIEKGFNRLRVGGRMMLVVKRADWYEHKLRSVFGGLRALRGEGNGYTLLISEKRAMRYAKEGRVQ